MAPPIVSVLLPVRDAAPWLQASLASLARQTLEAVEIVAVDDGSTDGSGERLERAARRLGPGRMRVARTAPRGLPAALNTALGLARAPFVARHDADDLSHPERLARQHAFLTRHPDAAVVGCRLALFPARDTGAGMKRWAEWHNALLTHDAMAREVLVDSPLAHGTAMLRRGWLERVGGWRERGWAEDLDLWVRLLDAGARFAKLPRVLYRWRQHPASATHRDPRYARAAMTELKRESLARRFHGAGPFTLVGTGASLERWRVALGPDGARVHAARHPDPAIVAALAPPLVLIVTAAVARERWRAALISNGMKETSDFIFVV
ncbi:MAG TPA: glycosyltransferase [Candidatus Eisenbacteria bacterium]|nr:glycosyltransferase [Candidatus Eisenbacteria bacterium]